MAKMASGIKMILDVDTVLGDVDINSAANF
jgi:hypothetical protein